MTFSFSYNSKTHDYWDIYKSIRTYYPIGLDKKDGKGLYYEYQGLKDLEKILVENVHNEKNFKDRWVDFTSAIGNEVNKEIDGKTFGQAPSFSSSIILLKNRKENYIQTKAVYFSVSFVGDYFQVYGLDETILLNRKIDMESSYVVTASPFGEYKKLFEFVEKKLRARYPKHRIIPFSIGQSIINGLDVFYLDDENCSINKALFNHFLSEDHITEPIKGDTYYGADNWQIKS